MNKQAYFGTLNEALIEENILDTWAPWQMPISYGETRIFHHEYDNGNVRRVSIYRDGLTGKYERPVHYLTS